MVGKAAKIVDCRDKVENIEIAWIPMKDGRKLAARLLLPKDPKDTARSRHSRIHSLPPARWNAPAR